MHTSFQERPHLRHHLAVGRLVGCADTRRHAASHVVPKARPLPRLERLAAVLPQGEDAVHQVEHTADGSGAGVRAEVRRAVFLHTTREDQCRVRLLGELQERVALVVLQQHVEMRLVALDEVRLEDQRFDLVGRHDELERGGAKRDQPALLAGVAPEVAAYAAAKVDRLADVQDLAVRRHEQVAAGLRGQHREVGGLHGQIVRSRARAALLPGDMAGAARYGRRSLVTWRVARGHPTLAAPLDTAIPSSWTRDSDLPPRRPASGKGPR